MAIVSLKFHPSLPPTSDQTIRCDAHYHPHRGITLQFDLCGDLEGIRVATPKATPEQRDGLWKSTCFEAFIGFCHDSSYREFNFSPSGDWAAYDFSDYRNGMTAIGTNMAPEILTERSDRSLRITAFLDRAILPEGFHANASDVRLALSCVLEGEDRSLSYWALHHPTEQPDFHHPDGFCLSIS